MKIIPLSEFRKLSGEAVRAAMPFTLTYNGENLATVAKADSCLILEDLHPKVQSQLRAKYDLVRRSMPAPEKVYVGKVSEIKLAA